jgi:hypothetical protein
MRAIGLTALAACTWAALSVPLVSASADDVIKVTWRKAQVMSFGSGVAGIIIGDPRIVDVTVEANGQIVVFGKTPGETNLIITGTDSSVLFNAPIVVMPEDNRQVSITNAGDGTISERSWTCLSRCVQVLGPGGTSYSSVRPQGGGSSASSAPADGSGAAASAAAGETAEGVAGANAATAQGASNVAGQGGGVIITP